MIRFDKNGIAHEDGWALITPNAHKCSGVLHSSRADAREINKQLGGRHHVVRVRVIWCLRKDRRA